MPNQAFFDRRQVAIALALNFGVFGRASAASSVINVSGGRPVAEAIDKLEEKYSLAITYEDPPYLRFNEIVDATDADWPGAAIPDQATLERLAQPHGGIYRRLVPRGSRLTVSLPDGPADREADLQAIIGAYNSSRGGEVFAIVHGEVMLHVVPRSTFGASGALRSVASALDTAISFEPKRRNGAEVVEEICAQISGAFGRNVFQGATAANILEQVNFTGGASGEMARSVLEKVIVKTGRRLSWRLFFSPGDNQYYLNTYNAAPRIFR